MLGVGFLRHGLTVKPPQPNALKVLPNVVPRDIFAKKKRRKQRGGGVEKSRKWNRLFVLYGHFLKCE